MGGDADLAAVAGLLADPRRCAILLALDDGRALPASRLAAEAGVSASTTSSHLHRLTEGGLLQVEQHGRHRYYRLADERVGRLLETVAQLSPQTPVRTLRQSGRARALREARTCYDHLAGRLGVELMAALLHDGHLAGGDGHLRPATRRPRPPRRLRPRHRLPAHPHRSPPAGQPRGRPRAGRALLRGLV